MMGTRYLAPFSSRIVASLRPLSPLVSRTVEIRATDRPRAFRPDSSALLARRFFHERSFPSVRFRHTVLRYYISPGEQDTLAGDALA